MKIEHIKVYGFEPSFRGMRNPMDSWADSDSEFYHRDSPDFIDGSHGPITIDERPNIGPNDLGLACTLIRRGSEHRKFLRQIMVWIDITVPRYVWQELDTYKVATTRMSCSTMHKLGSVDLDQLDFENPIPEEMLARINGLGKILRDAKARKNQSDPRGSRVQLKNDLPEGFLQKATYTMGYETALTMLLQRENHRLPQWRLSDVGSICEFLMSLPHMSEFYAAATYKRRALKRAKTLLHDLIIQGAESRTVNVEDLRDVMANLKEA